MSPGAGPIPASTRRADPAPLVGLHWLIAGDSPACDDAERTIVEHFGPAAVTRVPDAIAALGELARTTADVVLLDRSPPDLLRREAQTIRELAPAARLILLAGPDADPTGFDTALASPISPQAIRAALGQPEPAADDPLSPTQPTNSFRRRLDISTYQLDQFGRLRGPSTASEHDEANPADFLAPDAAPQIDLPVEPNDIGDIDLIDAILAGNSVRDLALDVVRARSGISGIFIADEPAGVPRGHLAEPITHQARHFGLLCAPAPDEAEGEPGGPPPRSERSSEKTSAPNPALAPWAAWIAHWLALDDHVTQLNDMSMRDALTGVWNRRYFDKFLTRVLDWAVRERSQVTLLVFDIDDFKLYNDKYGHAAGDEILKECSKLMLSVVRKHDVVARVGGDEFAVIFWDADPKNPRSANSRHPEDVVTAARRFQQAILKHNFPKLLSEAPGTLTISGGLASFPWDGRTPDELLDKADQMALQSKRAGKNAIMFGPGAERAFQMKRE